MTGDTPLGEESACDEALVVGRLAPHDAWGLVLASEATGEVTRIRWPAGFAAALAPELVLRDAAGDVVAAEGDVLYVGGGMGRDGLFVACGYVSQDRP